MGLPAKNIDTEGANANGVTGVNTSPPVSTPRPSLIMTVGGWFFGINFVLMGFVCLSGRSFVAAVAYLGIASLLIPPVWRILQKKFTATGGAKWGAILILFVIGVSNTKLTPSTGTGRTQSTLVKLMDGGQPSTTDPKPQFITGSCRSLTKMFGAGSQMSDIQKKEAWKNYEGRAFKWKLRVGEVSEAMLGGGYDVQFKCVPSDSFVLDISVSYPESAKDFALQLQKGSNYTISGTLKDYNGLIGLMADGM